MLATYFFALCMLLWLGRLLISSLKIWSKSRQYGCQPARSLPSWEPLLNADIFLEGLRDRKAHNHLEREISRYAQLDVHTYRMKSMGRFEIHTKHDDNFRQSLHAKAHSYGVGPMRGKGMSPFCGLGFLTTDGKIREQSRARLQPSFAREYITDMTVIDEYLTQLVEQLPLQTTFDFQEWILRIVSRELLA